MHNTHGFEEEENEHDVIDKVYSDIKPRKQSSKWVATLKNMAGEKYKISVRLDILYIQLLDILYYLK